MAIIMATPSVAAAIATAEASAKMRFMVVYFFCLERFGFGYQVSFVSITQNSQLLWPSSGTKEEHSNQNWCIQYCLWRDGEDRWANILFKPPTYSYVKVVESTKLCTTITHIFFCGNASKTPFGADNCTVNVQIPRVPSVPTQDLYLSQNWSGPR